MILAVLDTNVTLSAFLSPAGAPARVLRAWEQERFDVATSPILRAELHRALEYPKVKKFLKASADEVEMVSKRFEISAVQCKSDMPIEIVKRDRDDNHVLECARSAGADYIVTGDKDLLSLVEYEGIQILSPTEFLHLLEMGSSPKK